MKHIIHLIKVARGGTAIDWWLPDAKGKENGHTVLLANLKNAYVINTDDLSQRDDIVHFDQEGQMDLGKRFGEAMIKALK